VPYVLTLRNYGHATQSCRLAGWFGQDASWRWIAEGPYPKYFDLAPGESTLDLSIQAVNYGYGGLVPGAADAIIQLTCAGSQQMFRFPVTLTQ
jgi:hypothetical protein